MGGRVDHELDNTQGQECLHKYFNQKKQLGASY